MAGVERELDRLEREEADRAWLEAWNADQARHVLEALAREDPAADRSPGPRLRPSP